MSIHIDNHVNDDALALMAQVLPFLEAGVVKLLDCDRGEAEMAPTGLHPARAFNIASLVTELGGSALIILDRGTWSGAGALGIFTVFATFLAHRFWDFSGTDRNLQLNSFLEHAAICAAFILVVAVNQGGVGWNAPSVSTKARR
jgi:transmembrane protein